VVLLVPQVAPAMDLQVVAVEPMAQAQLVVQVAPAQHMEYQGQA